MFESTLVHSILSGKASILEVDVKTALIAVVLAYAIYFCRKSTTKISTVTKAKCPVATSSIFENVRELSSNRLPFFFLDTMRKLQSDIFKIPLPFLPGGGFYVVGDHSVARAILKDSNTDKPSFIYQPMATLVGGHNMFTFETSNPKWHVARKGIAPAFSSGEVRRMNSVCKTILSSWIDNELDEKITMDESFDPSIEMTWLTFRVILEAAFEYSNPTRNEYSLFHKSLEDGIREFTRDGSDPIRKFYRFFLPSGQRAFQATKNLREFAAKILDSYRSNKNKSVNNTVIKLIENNPHFSEEEKILEILTLLIGGHDTTGYMLANTMVLMAKYPDFAAKLKSDVEKYGVDESRYAKCVIQESTRVMPVSATGSVRCVGKDFILKDGSIVISKGSNVWIPFIIMFRNEKYFEDPDTFNPDRWLNTTGTMKSTLIPFALGNRDCIGQRLANAEIDHCVPYLFSKYKFELVEKGNPDYFLTLKYSGSKLKATKIT